MELLRTMPNLPPVILTTAYSEYALESYRFRVIDYLLKPVNFEDFVRAIQKLNGLFGQKPESMVSIPVPDEARPFLYVRSDKKMVRVYYNEIRYIEGLKDYVQIHLKDRKVITHQTLASFEEMLPNINFMRVHRSFIISLAKISAFTARTVEIGEREIPVGEVYQASINERLR
jgi:DNA-binding LytR/AlgR family response regulator